MTNFCYLKFKTPARKSRRFCFW